MERGDRWGKLTAVKNEGRGWFMFECDCGNLKSVYVNNVKQGKTKSCGCLFFEARKERADKYRVAADKRQAELNRLKTNADVIMKATGYKRIYALQLLNSRNKKTITPTALEKVKALIDGDCTQEKQIDWIQGAGETHA